MHALPCTWVVHVQWEGGQPTPIRPSLPPTPTHKALARHSSTDEGNFMHHWAHLKYGCVHYANM